jgi:sugar phosphate isomerase/epimerase
MKLGFLTACLPRRTLPEICKWAEAQGFEALEVAAGPISEIAPSPRPTSPSRVRPRRRGRVRELFARHHLELSSIAYYDNNLHPDGDERAASHAHLHRCIDAAALLGCPTVGTFVGRDPTRSVAENLRRRSPSSGRWSTTPARPA